MRVAKLRIKLVKLLRNTPEFRILPETDQRRLERFVCDDAGLLREFSREYKQGVVGIVLGEERDGCLNPLYFFSNKSGGYTREGIENSLKKSVVYGYDPNLLENYN